MAFFDVETAHPEYEALATRRKRARDCVSGQDAVREAGDIYLPRLSGDNINGLENDRDFGRRLARAPFFNASSRTVDGLVGLVFRKPPQVDAPGIDQYLDDVTLTGQDFGGFAESVLREVQTVGNAGVLVDYPTAGVGVTLADVQAEGLRPSLTLYTAENIINWRTTRVRNRVVLSQVVLREDKTTHNLDGFGSQTTPQWRVLDLDPDTGVYRIRVFQKDENANTIQVEDDVFPIMGGSTIMFIPFRFFGDGFVDEPPLIDLYNTNITHYQVSAAYHGGLHVSGLPQPWIAGWAPDFEDGPKTLSSEVSWCFPNPDTKVGYLEFRGDGLKNHTDAMSRLEMQMAVLGARMLEPQKKGTEAADTAAIHRAGENSVLASMVQGVRAGLEKCLIWFAGFEGSQQDNISVSLNTDFSATEMDPARITALIAGWQAGAIPKSVLAYQWVTGELTPPGTTVDAVEDGIVDQDYTGDV